MDRVYLDHNATSPVRPEVRAAVEPLLFGPSDAGGFGNASSVHWAGQAARRHLEGARTRVAAVLGRRPGEVVFTSGGTEADNLALDGVLGRRAGQLVLSAVEHPAVRAAADRWSKQGREVVEIPAGPDGSLDLDALARHLDRPTALVSVMAVNNETGYVHDLGAVRACVAGRAPLHVDAVQAAGRLDPAAFDADLVVVSGHKIGGLPGAGALIVRDGLGLDPSVVGGPQERGRRAGTESVAAAVGLAVALERAEAEREVQGSRLGALRDELERALRALPGATVLDRGPRVAAVSCTVFEGIDGEALLQALDLEGVAASSGSACSSGSLEPSPVLLALGYSPPLARSAVRFSLGPSTTAADIRRVTAILPALHARAVEAG